MRRDLSISLSRVMIITVQDFRTVTFIICIQAGLPCCFMLNEKGSRFKSVQLSYHFLAHGGGGVVEKGSKTLFFFIPSWKQQKNC